MLCSLVRKKTVNEWTWRAHTRIIPSHKSILVCSSKYMEKGRTSVCPFYTLQGGRGQHHTDTSLVRKASLTPFPGLLPYRFGFVVPRVTQVLVSLDAVKGLVLTPEWRVQAGQAARRPLVASLQSSMLFGSSSVRGVVQLGTAGNCLS